MHHIVFIHGMFQNPVSWERWVEYFIAHGYTCHAPAWPDHEGSPAELRAHPPRDLGDLRLDDVLDTMERLIESLDRKPIVIGHSVGGLVMQLLASRGLIELGIGICPVAPNGMLSLNWNFFKNSITIANPLKGDAPMLQTVESFHHNFCNTLNEAAAREAYERTATHDSRNVLRDCMMEPGNIDLEQPHPPLLLIAAADDHIIPAELVEKNAKAYEDENSVVSTHLFEHRSHYICNEPGWEAVAAYVFNWIGQQHQMK